MAASRASPESGTQVMASSIGAAACQKKKDGGGDNKGQQMMVFEMGTSGLIPYLAYRTVKCGKGNEIDTAQIYHCVGPEWLFQNDTMILVLNFWM